MTTDIEPTIPTATPAPTVAPVAATASAPTIVEKMPTETEKRITNLMKTKRHFNSGSTLNVENIASLVQWWTNIIQPPMWEESQAFLNDKTQLSMVLREHDFELLKAIRSFIQSGNQIRRMIDTRVDEINKLITDNQGLFDKLVAEAKEAAELEAASVETEKAVQEFTVADENKLP